MDNRIYENLDIDNHEQTLEDMLIELKDAVNKSWDIAQLYDLIRKEVLRELKYRQFAITHIMPDIIELRAKCQSAANVLQILLAYPNASYTEIGDKLNLTKQGVQWHLRNLEGRYMWLDDFLAMKNENYNRNRTFKQGGRP